MFEAPRDVLLAIPGLELVEFPENLEGGVCCGAGGGVKIGAPDLALIIAHEKIKSLPHMSAEIMASICPFCRRNLGEACASAESHIEVLDVIELVDRMMDP